MDTTDETDERREFWAMILERLEGLVVQSRALAEQMRIYAREWAEAARRPGSGDAERQGTD